MYVFVCRTRRFRIEFDSSTLRYLKHFTQEMDGNIQTKKVIPEM